ncbi:ATP-dependent 6-phosphofructokinase [Glaciecola sp. XM2]|uniref:ATP-dependent 6-phosphofructokinase n=1 Tax=Glaciecola sp. XM2 TaxID=1914931 RepID=UPI001BDEA51B|nr:ATP-dependent 6-phosphofructokinase [Glaciecola sp. XM2]MBT1451958.1 ATP-dependent 6-phosphofructokinase [Glaciecola sp. XM2]
MAVNKIAVLTSGGDAPGMNACIRAVFLAAQSAGIELIGYQHGYNGLINQEYFTITHKDIRNLIQRGGTMLFSARCEKFKHEQHRLTAAKHLTESGADGLIVIGGDGSFKGVESLQPLWDKPIVGVPGTIDNDVAGTDYTIGYHTAIQTAVESIDKVRDTADAFERIFIVDVMGREAGFIALNSAIAGGADHVILPETFDSAAGELLRILEKLKIRRKNNVNGSHIIVTTEQLWPGGLNILQESLQSETGIDTRILTLGHVQRGGSPVWQDRVLASKLGTYAVEMVLNDERACMAGIQDRYPKAVRISNTKESRKQLNEFSLSMLEKMALLG